MVICFACCNVWKMEAGQVSTWCQLYVALVLSDQIFALLGGNCKLSDHQI